ncbi:MAG: glycosyltransferase [Muribaculaceae bacterium]|nr:glycosyltransferase [Muribaculaceae bacterium]
MKVVLINKSDATGGAAVVSARLMEALRGEGVDARMLVAEKLRPSPYIELAASRAALRRSFMTERLRIFTANGFNRSTLFKIDTASDGVPLWRHRWVAEADIVCLNWINQGLLSLHGIHELGRLGKPVVWTMHDMWCATGVCHHAYDCRRYEKECGDCPLLGSRRSPDDLSHNIWQRKRQLYGNTPMYWVAVSNWLAGCCRRSSLMNTLPVSVIPNAFPTGSLPPLRQRTGERLRMVMGAARLDDPVKGLPILVELTKILARDYPQLAERLELVTFGAVRDATALDGIAIAHRHLGLLHGDDKVREVYEEADIVISSSLYETLPGTLVEGQAYGCIPVAFDRGGQSDIIDHGRTGWLAPFSGDLQTDAAALAAGVAWAAAQGHDCRLAARHSVEDRFSAPTVARAYITLFNSLLNSSASS